MDIRLPNLGEGAESGTVVSILVAVGDEVTKNQTLMELENEKAVAPIPSTHAGTVLKIHVKEGDQVSVGQVLLSLKGEGKEEKTPEISNSTSQPTSDPPSQSSPQQQNYSYQSKSGFAPPASPTLRRMARELGLDLKLIRGSEAGGRITLADLRAYIQRLQKNLPSAQKPVKRALPDFAKWGTVRKEKMSSLRTKIGDKMLESWTSVPHITQFDDIDVTEIMNLRKKYAEAYEKESARLTLTPFVLMAVVKVLKKHAVFNASLGENEIVYKDYYNLGIAVDTEQGLIVPVIKNANQKSLLELSLELQEIAQKTRDRKVALDDLQGGTFTISNQGGIGGAHFTPIINTPEVAILGLGRGSAKAVYISEKIEKRILMPVALSYDHRLIDGAQAARFITDLKQELEKFNEAETKGPL